MLVEHFNLLASPRTITNRNLISKHLLALEEHFEFLLIGLLVHARNDTIQLLNQPS